MRFPGIRLVEQTEQKFRRSESVFGKEKEKPSDRNSRALLLIKAPTKNTCWPNKISIDVTMTTMFQSLFD